MLNRPPGPWWLLVLVLCGCSTVPETAPREPWFRTQTDLLEKAVCLEDRAMDQVDSAGLFLYTAHEPLSDWSNYLNSHDLADAPAWQGCLMAALAFAEAVTGEDRDAEILRLARGLRTFHRVTGVRGLLGRSMIADYQGPRLDWMETREVRPTRYWTQGPTGAWWRNGLAKGHLALAGFGCAVPLILHRQGDLELEVETRVVLIDVLKAAVHHLVAGDYRIRDADGEATEHGNLRPQKANGFNMLLALSLLRSAAPYDASLKVEYEEKIRAWAPWMGWSLKVVGKAIHKVGHRRFEKPSFSDMQAAALAACALLMQEKRREHARYVRRALTGLWTFMQFERNAPFTLCYAALVRTEEGRSRLGDILEDLRDFPVDKRPRTTARRDTSRIQPLANRPISSHYWKSSPYRRVHGPLGDLRGLVYGGQDYLLAYWMGRYFDLVPER